MTVYSRWCGDTLTAITTVPARSVYPRWCGEHLVIHPQERLAGGLSPLARGTLTFPVAVGDECRFIPAGAGNTLSLKSAMSRTAVYPRWRGEHFLLGQCGDAFIGLSPLARGTQHQGVYELRQKRFIPAGAGNTGVQLANNIVGAVYPRWRGEH